MGWVNNMEELIRIRGARKGIMLNFNLDIEDINNLDLINETIKNLDRNIVNWQYSYTNDVLILDCKEGLSRGEIEILGEIFDDNKQV